MMDYFNAQSYAKGRRTGKKIGKKLVQTKREKVKQSVIKELSKKHISQLKEIKVKIASLMILKEERKDIPYQSIKDIYDLLNNYLDGH